MRSERRRFLGAAACAALLLPSRRSRASTVLTYWTFFNPADRDPRSQALKSIIDGFEAENPGIKVKVETIHWGKIGSLAIQAAAAGGGPDVIQIFSNQLTQQVKAGSIAPLDPFMADWARQHADDYLVHLQDLRYDGKTMAMPWELRALAVLYYRSDLLEAAGLPVPRTLTELSATAKRLSTDRVKGFAIGLSEAMLGSALVEMFDPLIGAYGGSLFDEHGHAAFNSSAGEQAMSWIRDLYLEGAMAKNVVTMNYDDVTSALKSGTVAMAFQGTHRIGTVRAAQPIGPTFKMALMPGVTADKPAPVLIAGQTLAIGANSPSKAVAWKFIEYVLSPPAQLLSAKAEMGPVLRSVYSDPYFQTPRGQELAQLQASVARYGQLHHYPEDFPRFCQLLARAAQSIILSNAPVKQALAEAAGKYDQDLSD